MIITTVLLVIYLLLRGVCEGIVMTMRGDVNSTRNFEGTRGNKYFVWYHILTILRDAIPLTYMVITLPPFLGAAIILGWECFELSYNYIRYNKFFIAHENVWGIYNINTLKGVYITHGIRIGLVIVLVLLHL